MPRLSEKEKLRICASEKTPEDKAICMKEQGYYSDYLQAVESGSFKGDFNEYKKSLGIGVITWTSTSQSETSTEQPKKDKSNKKMIMAFSIGLIALIGAYLLISNKKQQK